MWIIAALIKNTKFDSEQSYKLISICIWFSLWLNEANRKCEGGATLFRIKRLSTRIGFYVGDVFVTLSCTRPLCFLSFYSCCLWRSVLLRCHFKIENWQQFSGDNMVYFCWMANAKMTSPHQKFTQSEESDSVTNASSAHIICPNPPPSPAISTPRRDGHINQIQEYISTSWFMDFIIDRMRMSIICSIYK